jgi:hypothetical protein
MLVGADEKLTKQPVFGTAAASVQSFEFRIQVAMGTVRPLSWIYFLSLGVLKIFSNSAS